MTLQRLSCFVGPTLLSGIGQHCAKYVRLFPDAKYYLLNEEIPECDVAFLFLIPSGDFVERARYVKSRAKKVICMTVCETETVHEDYGKIVEEFPVMAVPSEFCRRVLARQFPSARFEIIRAHIPQPPPRPYTFYVIGNILDPRKQFRGILEAFIRLNAPDAKLLVKATCSRGVDVPMKNVEVINGLVSEEELDNIHERGDCYVSFSCSEGVGMGAVEAALRDKPVIVTRYGGAPEYVPDTPYTIECETQELERDDFLFKKGMTWGKPRFDQLCEFMRHAYEYRVTRMDHPTTRELVGERNVVEQFDKFLSLC